MSVDEKVLTVTPRTLREWELFARAVACPVCDAQPGRRCAHAEFGPKMWLAHAGRMVKAHRGDPDWWRKVAGAK